MNTETNEELKAQTLKINCDEWPGNIFQTLKKKKKSLSRYSGQGQCPNYCPYRG